MPKAPVVTMIAGPNGSGKSTLTDTILKSGIQLGIYINADEIAKSLIGDPEEISLQAQKIAEDRRQDCLRKKVSFSFETVMSHSSKVDLLAQARSLGYQVVIFFVALESPELSVERVRQRIRLGGHSVPEDRIRARYVRCLDLLPKALEQCDRAVLFDNSYRREALGVVRLHPFCEVRRVGAGLRFFSDKGELITRRDNLDFPLWASHVITDRVIVGQKRIYERNMKRRLARRFKAFRPTFRLRFPPPS